MNHSPTKIQILHIIKSLGRGGAERLLAETAALHSKKFQFDVVYFLPWKNQLVKELENLGCKVYLLPARYTIFMLFRIPALFHLVRRNRYSVLHCHLPWAGIVGKVAGKLAGIPVVYTEHNNFFTYNWVTRLLHKIRFNWFAWVITVSGNAEEALRQAMNTLPPLQTVLNGVNTVKFNRDSFNRPAWQQKLTLPEKHFIITTVAVFRHQKRLDRWLNIARALLDQDTGLYFIIIGDGPEKEKLMEQQKAAGLEHNVIFTGLLEDPRPYLACTDLYLMSSDYEGLPVALLEAMSMGCVPVVTEVGGIPGVVQTGVNGVLYKPDEEKQAVDAVLALKRNTNQLHSMSLAAREQIIRNFSMERMIHQLEQIYYRVITGNQE